MSKKLLTLDKTADYATLREWCMTILEFLVIISPEMLEFVNGMKVAIDRIDKKQSMRYMRSMYREMNLMVREMYLPDPLMDKLNQILTEKFKYNLVDVAAAEKDEIQKILKRGRIRNDREFELVKNKEEEIYDDDSQFDYAESLRSLLGDYEMNR
ncbi:hypothetical protein SAMN04487850_2274 [Prevotella aff. ruminicola Tc2-24]|uniref:Uncharacterized protein n=2 Tax=Prevotella aff. ruminicola Tc2-24 TaxID=81582 RepID=A0A1I0Q9V3_9BACT|nr:hypothetical protein SAMN04487850_2274 [Prevotella aff. ruminicola Tc2-24]